MTTLDVLGLLPRDIRERTVQYASREEWLASRRGNIGASSLASILDISVYKDGSSFREWAKQVAPDTLPAESNQDGKKAGHLHETAVIEEYAGHRFGGQGLLVVPCQLLVTAHPVYPILRGTPDALIFEPGDEPCLVRGLDAKFLGSDEHLGPQWTSALPMDYVLQGLAYCSIYGVSRWDFAIRIGGPRRFGIWRVPRDDAALERCLTHVFEWHERYVVTGVRPPLDGSAASSAWIRAAYPAERHGPRAATPELLDTWSRLLRVRSVKKRIDALDDRLSDELRDASGWHDGIEGVCTYRKGKDVVKVDYESAFLEIADSCGAPDQEVERILAKNQSTRKGSRALRIKNPPKESRT